MIARVPCFGGYGHRGGREVLHLLEVEVQTLGDNRQLGHVLLRASRMATDEVGDDLLAEVQLVVDLVEYLLEVVELGERWLAHDVEHRIAGVLGSYLEASAHVLGNEFAGIFLRAPVDALYIEEMQFKRLVKYSVRFASLIPFETGVFTLFREVTEI